VGIIDNGKLKLEARLDEMRAGFCRVRVLGDTHPAASGNDLVRTSTSGGMTEYVLRANGEAFAADLRSQGASVVDVTPLNLSEIFLEVVGRGKTDVHG
jgi:ABC-2 type transport system ATP-binding protein